MRLASAAGGRCEPAPSHHLPHVLRLCAGTHQRGQAHVTFSIIGLPLTLLYAAITSQAGASRTHASKGTRYSSRSVVSSIRAS
jgi:hypothetical protein